MELRQYGQLARKWLWLVVLCALAAGSVAYVVSKKSTPIYQASTKLLVNQASTASQFRQDTPISSPASSSRAPTPISWRMARWSKAWPSASACPPISDRLRGSRVTITVTPIRETQLLEVKVEGPDPTLTAPDREHPPRGLHRP